MMMVCCLFRLDISTQIAFSIHTTGHVLLADFGSAVRIEANDDHAVDAELLLTGTAEYVAFEVRFLHALFFFALIACCCVDSWARDALANDDRSTSMLRV
jgi:hypothetical protein